MERVEQIFRHKAHLKILLLYYKNNELVVNIGKLSKIIGMNRTTTKQAINDLIEVGVLDELIAGRSRVIRVANTTQAQLIFEFIEKINGGFVLKKTESFTKLELAEAEIRRLDKVLDALRKDYASLFSAVNIECKTKRRPMKIKDALNMCHRSRHYKLVYEALRINSGKLQGFYQEYCTLCESKDIKPLVESSMSHYITELVKDGKITRVGGGKYDISGW